MPPTGQIKYNIRGGAHGVFFCIDLRIVGRTIAILCYNVTNPAEVEVEVQKALSKFSIFNIWPPRKEFKSNFPHFNRKIVASIFQRSCAMQMTKYIFLLKPIVDGSQGYLNQFFG